MSKELKAFIIDVIPKGTTKKEEKARINELTSLVNTLGGIDIIQIIQKRTLPDHRTFIGSGKLEEIREAMESEKADILIIGNNIKPRQIYTIGEELAKIKAKCRDRIDLILKIFGKNAESTEARLQIELASIKHMGPRIFGMGLELGRQGGGAVTSRGIGETNTEIMRRHLQQRRIAVEKKLKEYEKMRKLHRQSRKKRGLKTVGIVGYTNAGKSTLLQALTNKEAYQANKLFATLGTQVGSMRYWTEGMTKPDEVLISDTIGFIRDLPPKLIQAFKSTLEDSIHSDLLLHVVDAADPEIKLKMQVVDEILEDIGATQEKIYVFNKGDQLSQTEKEDLVTRFEDKAGLIVSAIDGYNIEMLKMIIHKKTTLN